MANSPRNFMTWTQQNLSRRPSSPRLPLERAVELTRLIWNKWGTSPTSLSVIADVWETHQNAGFRSAVAAVKQFGLMEDLRVARPRQLKVTDQARYIIIQPQEDLNRATLLRQIALSPAIYAELWSRFGKQPRSDGELECYLWTEQGFSARAARDLVPLYKMTMFYAKFHDDPPSSVNDVPLQQGDLVVCNLPGILEAPAPVLHISHSGTHVVVEGCRKLLEVKHLRVVEHVPRANRSGMPHHDPSIVVKVSPPPPWSGML